jgi:hypothetical protein
MGQNKLRKYISQIIKEELNTQNEIFGLGKVTEDLSESGGILKVEQAKDGKYYWTFTFKSGKVEKWPNGFATSAEAQKDFIYRSKYLKEGTFNSKREEKENIDETWYRMKVLAGVIK